MLVYVVVLMLIFGILGVVMVSLFSSSIGSAITRNDSRRALYMAESGMRYAFSEIRKADFDPDFMINTLNAITYRIGGTESFTINAFSPWFESSELQSLGNDDALLLTMPIGELPDGYTIPASGVYAINYEFTGDDLTSVGATGSSALIKGFSFDKTNPTVTLGDDFNAGSGERVSLAVFPRQEQTLVKDPPRNLEFTSKARFVFPKYGGAITIIKQGGVSNRGGIHEYFYEQRIDYPPADNRIVLRKVTAAPGTEDDDAYPLTVTTSDWIILSPRNHMVAPTGESDGTKYGGDYTFAKGIFDPSLIHQDPDLKLTSLSEQETDTRFFELDTIEDKLYIGGGGGGGEGLTDQFGSAFFDADASIGGDQDYCEQGACLFGPGVRAFFLVNFSQQGEGITFTLLGKGFPAPATPNNSASSVGGDFELSELMGYAGDSRLVANPDPLDDSDFLATNPDDRGLDPPKIAVEFDTRTDNATFDYCEDPLNVNVNQNTRNDPLAGNKDAVQYVFWGQANSLNIPCRDDPPTSAPLYDDNRHDADGEDATEEWRFGTSGLVTSSPAVGSDGTIYVVSDGKLYAINPDGSPKWDSGTNLGLSPAYDDNGTPADITDDTIYATGNSNGMLYAFKSNGDPKGLSWPFDAQEDFDGSPTVGPDHTIYAGRNWNSTSPGQVIAVNPDGTPRGLNWPFEVPTAVENDIDAPPVVDDNGTPADTSDDTIYAGSEDGFFYAINPDGTFKWSFNTGYVTTAAAIGADGTIYVGSHNDNVYAINPDGTPKGLSWPFTAPSGNIMTSPAIDPNDGTIYVGSDDGHLYAINPNGTEKWRFPDPGSIGLVQSSPVIDSDGTIYFGSNDGNVYAVNSDGTERWQFPTLGPVKSSPAIGKAGIIQIGSDDTNVYAISQFADPRNIKDKLLTSAELDSSVLVNSTTDWLNGAGSRGSWAVRLEVDRALLPNIDGEFDYELRLWMRQCPDTNDIPCDNILGTFYQDTRIEYDYTAVEDLPMRQSFSLSGAEQDAFESFFFGFTGAAGAEALDVTISQFQLSFIRPGDPVVDCDKLNWPIEAPVPDCLLIE